MWLPHQKQKAGVESHGDSRNFYGTIMSRKRKIGFNVSFDAFIADYKEVRAKN